MEASSPVPSYVEYTQLAWVVLHEVSEHEIEADDALSELNSLGPHQLEMLPKLSVHQKRPSQEDQAILPKGKKRRQVEKGELYSQCRGLHP